MIQITPLELFRPLRWIIEHTTNKRTIDMTTIEILQRMYHNAIAIGTAEHMRHFREVCARHGVDFRVIVQMDKQ